MALQNLEGPRKIWGKCRAHSRTACYGDGFLAVIRSSCRDLGGVRRPAVIACLSPAAEFAMFGEVGHPAPQGRHTGVSDYCATQVPIACHPVLLASLPSLAATKR
jgi:hypothetical protein